MFDGTLPVTPPQPDYRALMQQYAQLRLDECNRMGNDIVLLRVELVAVRGELEKARAQIAELEAVAARHAGPAAGGLE